MPSCKACGADILWFKTLNGKNMPVDVKPEKRFVIVKMDNPGKIVDTYMPHWATCPDYKKFKKGGPQ